MKSLACKGCASEMRTNKKLPRIPPINTETIVGAYLRDAPLRYYMNTEATECEIFKLQIMRITQIDIFSHR